jgi:hypothetical protein
MARHMICNHNLSIVSVSTDAYRSFKAWLWFGGGILCIGPMGGPWWMVAMSVPIHSGAGDPRGFPIRIIAFIIYIVEISLQMRQVPGPTQAGAVNLKVI